MSCVSPGSSKLPGVHTLLAVSFIYNRGLGSRAISKDQIHHPVHRCDYNTRVACDSGNSYSTARFANVGPKTFIPIQRDCLEPDTDGIRSYERMRSHAYYILESTMNAHHGQLLRASVYLTDSPLITQFWSILMKYTVVFPLRMTSHSIIL